MGYAVLIMAGLLYFLPVIVADRRKHQNTAAIGVINFFLGWTFLGWVLAFAWSCTAVKQPEQIIRKNSHQTLTRR